MLSAGVGLIQSTLRLHEGELPVARTWQHPTDQGKLQLKHQLRPPFPVDLMRVKLHDSRAR